MRVEHPGAVWHSKDRGYRQEDILVDDVDRQDLKQKMIELTAGELGENATARCIQLQFQPPGLALRQPGQPAYPNWVAALPTKGV